MPSAKADNILELVLKCKEDIFTPDILERMEVYYCKLLQRKNVDRVIAHAQREAQEVIEEFCSCSVYFPTNIFFQTVPNRIRWAMLLRFHFFEEHLRSHQHGVMELPSEFPLILRYGLIDLWNEGQNLEHRKN